LAKQQFNLRAREVAEPHAKFVPFSAQTRMSGVDFFDGTLSENGSRGGPAQFALHIGSRTAPSAVATVESPIVATRTTRSIRKGAAEAIRVFVDQQGGTFPKEVSQGVDEISRSGGTPLVVAEGREVLGVVQLKDVVKGGIKERFAHLRKMGIRTVMI